MRRPSVVPHIHTPLPAHRGEREFAEKLIAASSDRVRLWFCLQVPGGNELDVLLLHESIGAFAIEVKAVPLGMVTEYGFDKCVIEGRAGPRPPVKQAHWAVGKLRDFLKDVGISRPPFFFSTAAFPRIDSHAMATKFQGDGIAGKAMAIHFGGLIFEEHGASRDILDDRLRQIALHPPVGPSPRMPVPSSSQITELIEATTGQTASDSKVKPGPKNSIFITSPGKSQKASIEKFLTPAQRSPVVITGRPGTGKTQALLDIAISHADAGRTVLFTCFNKVLATSLRASLAGRDVPQSVANKMLVKDVYDIRTGLKNEDLGVFADTFGTICVDEAQDICTYDIEFVRTLAAGSAEWFYGDGPGQELYNYGKDDHSPASRQLEEARSPGGGIVQPFRRNFRSGPGMLFAQGVYDSELDVSKAATWADEHRAADEQTLDLEVAGAGEFPTISRLELADPLDDQEVVGQYAQAIRDELSKVQKIGESSGLMVMVPRLSSQETRLVRKALMDVGADFLDQVDESLRRQALGNGQVRFVTIHSARGVQAGRAILFGAHDLAFGGTKKLPPLRVNRNAGYIALTRATHGTRVVLVEGRTPSQFQEFVEA